MRLLILYHHESWSLRTSSILFNFIFLITILIQNHRIVSTVCCFLFYLLIISVSLFPLGFNLRFSWSLVFIAVPSYHMYIVIYHFIAISAYLLFNLIPNQLCMNANMNMRTKHTHVYVHILILIITIIPIIWLKSKKAGATDEDGRWVADSELSSHCICLIHYSKNSKMFSNPFSFRVPSISDWFRFREIKDVFSPFCLFFNYIVWEFFDLHT